MKFYQLKFMRKIPFSLLIVMAVVFNCKQSKPYLKTIEGKRITIDSTLGSNESIEAIIAPYREHIERDLDSVLAYAKDTYSKTDGDRNTAIGNLMADIILSEGSPILKKRTGQKIDVVLLNYGGIRDIIPKGPISSRTAFKVMPFENEIVVAGLKGKQVEDAINYLINGSKAHPIAGLNLIVDKSGSVLSATIGGDPIDPERVYYFATSDYLYNGGDNMAFFRSNESFHSLDYKIRNAMIDYFKKVDTINPVIDTRFIIQ